MIVEFGEEYLRDLYTRGECNDKRHRYRIDVIKRYKRGIDYLKWAARKEDLFRINSLKFEALKGSKAGRFFYTSQCSIPDRIYHAGDF